MIADVEQVLFDRHQVLLVLENYALGTTGTTVSTNSDATTGTFTPNNLLNDDLSKAWRSGSLAPYFIPLAKRSASGVAAESGIVRLRFHLESPQVIDWISLHRHNIRAPFRVKLFRSQLATASPVAESAWIDPIVRARIEDFGWLDLDWTLGPDERDLADWTTRKRLDSFCRFTAPLYGITRVDVEVNVSDGNAGVDYLQIGLPLIARHYQPTLNAVLGWDVGLDDRSVVEITEAGAHHGRRRTILRSLTIDMPLVGADPVRDISEPWVRMFRPLRRGGLLGRCLVWIEPLKRRYFYDSAFVAVVQRLPSLRMAQLEWPGFETIRFVETE